MYRRECAHWSFTAIEVREFGPWLAVYVYEGEPDGFHENGVGVSCAGGDWKTTVTSIMARTKLRSAMSRLLRLQRRNYEIVRESCDRSIGSA